MRDPRPTTPTATPTPAAVRRRLLATTAALTATGLAAAYLADRWLPGTGGINLTVLQLRLTYNPGVAFGLGASLPAWTITSGTAVIIAGLAGYATVTAPRTGALGRLGLAAILAGAIANLVDRALDGVVTDYLHTGWFPTFNLPDVFITIGAAAFILAALLDTHPAVGPTVAPAGSEDIR